MSVTGHKSVNSLAIYQRVKNDEKLMIGMSLAYNLFFSQEVYDKMHPAPKPPAREIEPKNLLQITGNTNSTTDLVPYNPNKQPEVEENNFDILYFINDASNNEIVLAATQMEKQFEASKELSTTAASTTTTTTTTLVKTSPKKQFPVPIFTNCKIGTININIYKQ